MNEIISNIFEGEKKDIILEDDNIIFQITTTEYQKKNYNKNISTINLKECETLLKGIYNISLDQPLLIFKIDYFKEDLLIPIIEYEIYHPITKQKLDLNNCSNYNISLNIPVSINEDNLYKYDPKNEYYTDNCQPSTTEYGTDILLNDRQNEFNNNNMSLCEQNCDYNTYNFNNKKVECDCIIKNEQNSISEIDNQKDILLHEFSEKNDMNAMKCVKIVFTKDGLKNNIGNYVLLLIIFIFIISATLFYKCGYNILEGTIKEVYMSIITKNHHKYKTKPNNKKEKSINNKKNTKNTKKNLKKNTKNTKKNLKKNKNKKKGNIYSNDLCINNKIKNKSNKSKFNNKSKESQSPSSKINIKINKVIVYNNNENIFKKKKKALLKKKEPNNSINLNDFELNSLSYENALKYDKRNFSSYYISLIKTKHPLIFHFCPMNDYNSIIIRICLFFLSFSFYYFINNLFFDESMIHKIYEDEGIYNFTSLIPYISYSFIISHALSTIFKYIFLSERNIGEIKKEKIRTIDDKINKVKRCIIIKYICFFILSILFLIFFWYYLSSFGAVYQNTQFYSIKNTLICFGISFIYPFFINVLPTVLRIYAITNKKKSLYKFSRVVQFL